MEFLVRVVRDGEGEMDVNAVSLLLPDGFIDDAPYLNAF